ncbi:hypothetical protein [Leptospira licerasiae]|uniref:hypothetical protein n=1 Tax=Leptospira licerasiae TaxID=447106 RepID=UPI0010842DA1|nr:hypothetical protein [Leptospira licerasiae]TGM85588.1 hypothetical protein EHR05_18725 [Leptospira licerasiae]
MNQIGRGDKVIWVGESTNPFIKIGYFLWGNEIEVSVTESEQARDYLLNHTNEEFQAHSDFGRNYWSPWVNFVFLYDESKFKDYEKRINFYIKKEKHFKEIFPKYGEYYDNNILHRKISYKRILWEYYSRRFASLLKLTYRYMLYPLINIITHDIVYLFRYTPRIAVVRDGQYSVKQEIKRIEEAIYYKPTEKVNLTRPLKEQLNLLEIEESELRKNLSEINKSISTIVLTLAALFISWLSSEIYLQNKKFEFDRLLQENADLKKRIFEIEGKK